MLFNSCLVYAKVQKIFVTHDLFPFYSFEQLKIWRRDKTPKCLFAVLDVGFDKVFLLFLWDRYWHYRYCMRCTAINKPVWSILIWLLKLIISWLCGTHCNGGTTDLLQQRNYKRLVLQTDGPQYVGRQSTNCTHTFFWQTGIVCKGQTPDNPEKCSIGLPGSDYTFNITEGNRGAGYGFNFTKPDGTKTLYTVC